MKSSMLSLLLLPILILAQSCASEDNKKKNTNPAQNCGLPASPKVLSVSKKAGAPECPDLTPAQLNEPDDAGDDSCTTTVSPTTCNVALSCETTEPDGTVTNADGLFNKTGSSVSGDLAVTISSPDGTSVSCTYALVLG
jgi:hypothetical protein